MEVGTPLSPSRNLIFRADTLDIFFQLYGSARGDDEMSRLVLSGVAQLASVSGKIFGEDASKTQYLSKLLAGLLGYLALFE
jgi:hypothetical protein